MNKGNVWILGEQKNGNIKTVSFELLARGRHLADKLGVKLVALLMGKSFDDDELKELIYYGADKVLVVEDYRLEYFLPEPYTNVMVELIKKYSPEIIIASATTMGRTLMPAVATKCNTGLTADCTGLDIEEGTGNLIQTRPAIGGNILATIKTPNTRPQMATVRPHSNKPLKRDFRGKGDIEKVKIDGITLNSRVKRVGFREIGEEGANIQDAEIVVAGGRGFKKEDNFKMVHELAKLLDGAIGASRDAVDLGWVSYPHQVGLSGKTISPKLYIAIGISGSVQHLAGIKTAENIIAINNDPEAQIFHVSDLGIVADLFDFLPALIERIKKIRTRN